MKKLLGILVLGLLWCNIAFAEKTVLRNKGDLRELLLQKGLTFEGATKLPK